MWKKKSAWHRPLMEKETSLFRWVSVFSKKKDFRANFQKLRKKMTGSTGYYEKNSKNSCTKGNYLGKDWDSISDESWDFEPGPLD